MVRNGYVRGVYPGGSGSCGESVHLGEMVAESGALCRRFLLPSHPYGGGEGDLTKNLFPLQKSTPAYRILHYTLLKHREMMISIS